MREPTPDQPVFVTAVPEAGRLIVHYGDESERVIDFSERSTIPRAIVDRITHCLSACAFFGTETNLTSSLLLHNFDPVDRGSYSKALQRFAALAPEIVEEVPGDKAKTFRFRVADLAIRSATTVELAEYAFLTEGTLPNEAELEVLHKQAHEDDKSKLQLMNYDHVRITRTTSNDTRSYILPLTSPVSFVASRVIECIARCSSAIPYKIDDICMDVFRSMSLAERAQLFDDETNIYLPSGDLLRDQVDQIISQLTIGMDIAVRGRERDAVYVTANVLMDYSGDHYQNEQKPGDRIALSPGEARDTSQLVISEAERTLAEQLVALLGEERPISHGDAIEYLDLIMSSSGKQAFREAIEAAALDAEEPLTKAHALIRNSLSFGSYYSAVRARRIAGSGFTNKTQHKARQTGGGPTMELPPEETLAPMRRRWEFVD